MRRSKQPRDAINYGINLAAIPGRMPKQAILLPVIRLEVESATTEGTDQDGGQPVEGAHRSKPILGRHKSHTGQDVERNVINWFRESSRYASRTSFDPASIERSPDS